MTEKDDKKQKRVCPACGCPVENHQLLFCPRCRAPLPEGHPCRSCGKCSPLRLG
jgi:hypothetical protein